MKSCQAVLCTLLITILYLPSQPAYAVERPKDILWTAPPQVFVESLYEGVLGRRPRTDRDWQSVRHRTELLRAGRITRLELFWSFINSDEYQASQWANSPRTYGICWNTRILDPPRNGRTYCHCYQFAEFCKGYLPNPQYTSGIPYPATNFTFGEAAALSRLYCGYDQDCCPHYDCAGGDLAASGTSGQANQHGQANRHGLVPHGDEPFPGNRTPTTGGGIFRPQGMSDAEWQEHMDSLSFDNYLQNQEIVPAPTPTPTESCIPREALPKVCKSRDGRHETCRKNNCYIPDRVEQVCMSRDGRNETCRKNNCYIPDRTERVCLSRDGRNGTCRKNGCNPIFTRPDGTTYRIPCYWEDRVIKGIPCYWEERLIRGLPCYWETQVPPGKKVCD